jgi:transposase
VTAADNRLFVEAVLYRYRAGIPWRDLPERFGDWNNTHRRFSRWAKSGVWKRVFQHLAADADNEYAMIDSTIVRAHQHSAGAQKKTARTRRFRNRMPSRAAAIHEMLRRGLGVSDGRPARAGSKSSDFSVLVGTENERQRQTLGGLT